MERSALRPGARFSREAALRSRGGSGGRCVTEISMNAALESGWLLRWYLIAVVGSAVLLTASPANGDVGVTAVSPRIGSPGQPVELEVGCGGGCGPRLSISLVPRSRAPTYLPCDRRDRARARRAGHVIPKGAVCAPTSRQLPRKPPYVFLGWAKGTNLSSSVTRYRLGFRVPRVRPGAYKFVIWRPPGGSLIADDLLRVRAEQSPADSPGSGTDAAWFIAAAVAVAAIAGAAVFLHRRRAQ
jgi:hypothetical protein